MENLPATLLVVDDSPVSQRILVRLLEKAGFTVLAANSGADALDVLRIERPDLIVLDIVMPDMDGIALCGHIKQDWELRDVPIIFISSLEDTADKIRGFEAGGVDYITKPFHHAEVLARINTHLKLCRLQRQLEEQNRQIEREKEKSEALLLNVLPAGVARELMEHGFFAPQNYEDVSVCFIDIVQFTSTASQLDPEELIDELNILFTDFDRIIDLYQCERMKTIGDAYLFVCGISEKNDQHVDAVANAALSIVDYLKDRNSYAPRQWQIRVGIHRGPLVGGLVGTKKYLYDIFGDTVNIASRLESMSPPMHITVSSQVHDSLVDSFVFSEPMIVEMKGKGQQTVWQLEGLRPF